MPKVIGIDLGTTFSAAAYVDDEGRAKIIPNYEGENLTPSAVLIEGKDITVGKDAKRSGVRHPEQYIAFAKRAMGNRDTKFNADGKVYTPEETSAMILRKIVADCEKSLNDTVAGAVVTVPAYFTDAQRKATQDAARLANLPLLAIINEPTAAALGYGISQNDQSSKTILVYDLGGGTFDVCIMRIGANKIETLAQEGAQDLGGYNFDKIIVDSFLEKATKKGIDVTSDPKAMQELWIVAEEVKKKLSKKDSAKIEISFKGEEVSVPISREEFETEISPLVFNTIDFMEIAVESAGLDFDSLDSILLVGGSTRIPLVCKLIEETAKFKPSTEMHPDEAVALGAAYYAVHCARQQGIGNHNFESVMEAQEVPKNSQLTTDAANRNDVALHRKGGISLPKKVPEYEFAGCTSHSIGVVTFDGEKEVNDIVIPKNTKLPARESRDYFTVQPFQDVIELRITEGEFQEMEHTREIAKTELNIRPREETANVRLFLECDENGLIHAHMSDIDDDINLGEINIPRNANMTASEMRESAEKLGKLNIGD